MLCITRLENVLQVLALVGLGWRLCPTNYACTCKMAFSSLVIQITTRIKSANLSLIFCSVKIKVHFVYIVSQQ
jgi:hypothetical protein